MCGTLSLLSHPQKKKGATDTHALQVMASLGELWDEEQYREEFDADAFLAALPTVGAIAPTLPTKP